MPTKTADETQKLLDERAKQDAKEAKAAEAKAAAASKRIEARQDKVDDDDPDTVAAGVKAHNDAREAYARGKAGLGVEAAKGPLGFLGDLEAGDNGPGVEVLQALLRARGYGTSIDGNFGRETQAALRAFLVDDGATDDERLDVGFVDSKRWGALTSAEMTYHDQGPHTISPPSSIASQQPGIPGNALTSASD